MGTGVVETFLTRREALIATAEPGTHAARELSDLTDTAVSALAGAAVSRAGAPFALFALGGYGARRLLPHSDIDLLVISSGRPADLEPLVRGLFYPLWDGGFTVGHQVRSPKAQIQALRDDGRNLTAFMTARFLAGDATLAERTIAECFRRIARDAAAVRRELLARERPGSPYLLEPDLKEGAGGQRDIDELVWHAALRSGAPAHDTFALLEAGLLEAREVDAVEEAQEAVSAARWRLHAHADSARNVLSVDDAEAADVDADAVQRALERVHHTLLAVRGRVHGSADPGGTPLGLPDLVAAAHTGPAALHELERAAWLGGLDDAAPGFARSMTLRRPGLSHRYTVGAHCLRTLTLLARPGPEAPPVTLDTPTLGALVTAALVHDAGKAEPGPGHAERGAEAAREAAIRLGLSEREADDAATLVAEHLLLSEVAGRSDVSDEDVVLTAAARVGDLRLVRPLYLLTAADMQATGPDVWTPWRAAVVGDLAARMEAALSPGVDGAGIVAAAEQTRADARRRASKVGASRTVLGFLEHAPLRYLARRSAEDVLRDARLVQSLGGPGSLGEFAYGTRSATATDTWLLDIVVRDRPGLFALLAGSIELSGLDVLAAEAFTEQAGIALDTFVVTSATHAAVTDSNWHAFQRNVDDVLAGRADLDARLAERRSYYRRTRRRQARVSAETHVTAGPRGAFSTTVHVCAHDRVGLLYDLARAIDRAGLDIRRAMITTSSGVADDVFEVTDAEGAPPQVAVLEETLVPLLEEVARAER